MPGKCGTLLRVRFTEGLGVAEDCGQRIFRRRMNLHLGEGAKVSALFQQEEAPVLVHAPALIATQAETTGAGMDWFESLAGRTRSKA
jgi:hypothetical protein